MVNCLNSYFNIVVCSYNRGWFYHKEHRLWFIRIGEPLVKTNTYERGSYHCFDPNTFEIIRKVQIYVFPVLSIYILILFLVSWVCFWVLLVSPLNVVIWMQENFVLHYEMLEKRPALPQH